MEQKKKLTINQQISDLKEKNVCFEIKSEADARRFLEYNNYYYKLKQYLQVFDKGSKVDFAYLQELSTLDYHFRKSIISMALDIEHFLKVKLINDITSDDTEDGYRVVKSFLRHKDKIADEIRRNAEAEADSIPDDLTEIPVWHLVELLGFRYFCQLFIEYYTHRHEFKQLEAINRCIDSTIRLRNASAHNVCLLSTLKNNDLSDVNRDVYIAVENMGIFKAKVLDKKLYCRTMHDYVSMLYLFCLLCSNDARKNMRHYTLDGIKDKLHDRFVYHKDYFKGSSFLVSHYEFITKLIDAVIENNYSFD